jgi:malonyl-CoA O-methyltransferase
MTLIAKELGRNRAVARRFGARARNYDAHADLQRDVAAGLARRLPALAVPSVLEVGCGTGFLTRHLLRAYPEGRFLITDLAPEMVEQCEAGHGNQASGICRFAILDGETPECGERFDLIAASMTLQWFADPLAGLARLKALLAPGGALWFATLGPENFPEWRAVLAAEGLPDGTVAMPPLPGIVHEERVVISYDSGRAFLAGMRSVGATQPRPGYRPLPPGALRRALRRLEHEHDGRVTWHLVYGRLTRDG